MSLFHYKGLAANGAVAEGQIEAGGRPEALRLIEAKGLRPITLAERSGKPGRNGKPAPAKTGNGTPADAPRASPSPSAAVAGFPPASSRTSRACCRASSRRAFR